MAPTQASQATGASGPNLPEGYCAVPIHPVDSSPLRLCAVVARRADPVAGPFVVLRDLADAVVYLGCVTDSAGSVREWVELWVQNIDGLLTSLPALREALSNHALDQRWIRLAATVRQLSPSALLETGWEETHPRPCFLDLARNEAVVPGRTNPGGPWELCRDDARLTASDLPPYGTSLARYLHQPGLPSAPLVPAAAGAPSSPACATLEQAMPEVAGLVPFNPQAGLMLAQALHPIPYDEYADLLGGKPWAGAEVGRRQFGFDAIHGSLGDWQRIEQDGRHLLAGLRGRAGRMVETFHLKVQLIADAIGLVRACVERTQLPFLNIGADSFRVRLRPAGRKLPIFWTAECALAKPSDAFALPVDAGQFRYFMRARPDGMSIYQPSGLGQSVRGVGSVRVRKVFPPENGCVSIEGTLVTDGQISVSPRDLLWMRLPLPAGRVDLYGHLYSDEGLAAGEARFRTFAQPFPAMIAKALPGAEGISFPKSPFEVVPLQSSPCDLHALGVLAVRTLLVNDHSTLAQALDETLSLARQLADEPQSDLSPGERVAAVLNRDERYRQSLGPHRLIADGADPEAVLGLVPGELWADALGLIVRHFPGLCPDSFCQDYGDAPALALETAFDQALAAWDRILVRSRSLLMIDWQANREIRNVIQKLR